MAGFISLRRLYDHLPRLWSQGRIGNSSHHSGRPRGSCKLWLETLEDRLVVHCS